MRTNDLRPPTPHELAASHLMPTPYPLFEDPSKNPTSTIFLPLATYGENPTTMALPPRSRHLDAKVGAIDNYSLGTESEP